MAQQEIVLEVAGRECPSLRYPYACAFLDGHQEPSKRLDIDRFLRLMAYDMVRENGANGQDPASIYATSMALVHTIQGHGKRSWEWSFDDFRLRATPCNEAQFASNHQLVPVKEVEKPHDLDEWRQQLESESIPALPVVNAPSDSLAYPEPAQAILAASLMTLSAAQAMIGPERVAIWFDKGPGNGFLLELWNEKTSTTRYAER